MLLAISISTHWSFPNKLRSKPLQLRVKQKDVLRDKNQNGACTEVPSNASRGKDVLFHLQINHKEWRHKWALNFRFKKSIIIFLSMYPLE